MRIDLSGQVALVTGASSGIGAGVARALAQAGAAVGVNHHSDADAADRVVSDIIAAGGRARAFAGDVSDEGDIARLFAAVASAFGALDIVVANAGRQDGSPIDDMTLAKWQGVVDLDLTGAFLSGREAIRHFRRQGRRGVSRALGKLLFTSSVHSVVPWAGNVNYAAAKAGGDMLMRSLAQEVAGEGIRVNAVAPSTVRSEGDPATQGEEGQRLLGLIPYGRFCDVADVARAVAWMVSDEADFVVGTTLFVDGGMTLCSAFNDTAAHGRKASAT